MPARTSIEIPDDVSTEDAKRIVRSLATNDALSVESFSEETDGEAWIATLSTDPSLLSWGEEVVLRVTDTEIEIESSAPDQIIDWGKPRENVATVSTIIEDEFANSPPTA